MPCWCSNDGAALRLQFMDASYQPAGAGWDDAHTLQYERTLAERWAALHRAQAALSNLQAGSSNGGACQLTEWRLPALLSPACQVGRRRARYPLTLLPWPILRCSVTWCCAGVTPRRSASWGTGC